MNGVELSIRPKSIRDSRLMSLALAVLVCLSVLGALYHLAPNIQTVPNRDSGVFLYAADRILQGDMLYQDVWDHKPPAIHYIDALGLIIGAGTRWGVWLVELASLVVAGLLSVFLLQQAFGVVPAVFALVAWLPSLMPLLEGGNLPEEFALPLQFAGLYLFWHAESKKQYTRLTGFISGAIFALAFMLKFNVVGVWLAGAMYLFLRRTPRNQWFGPAHNLIAGLVGALSVLMCVVVYFAANGASADMWDAVIRYNMSYSEITLHNTLRGVLLGLQETAGYGLSAIALAAWFIGAFCLIKNDIKFPSKARPLVAIAVIAMPVELLLSSLTGRFYSHYYVTLLPTMTILAAFAAYALTREELLPGRTLITRMVIYGAISVYAVVLIRASLLSILSSGVGLIGQQIPEQGTLSSSVSGIVEYMKQMTQEGDFVLVWGAEATVNYLAQRQSPTRFVYQYPLFAKGYQNPEMVESFLYDISMRAPKLILDTSATNPVIPPLDEQKRAASGDHQRYGVLPEMAAVFAYIARNYRQVGEIDNHTRWSIYVHQEPH